MQWLVQSWEGTAVLQLMLSLSARPWWVVSFRPRVLYPLGGEKKPRYVLYSNLGRPWGVGLDGCGEEKKVSCPHWGLNLEPFSLYEVSICCINVVCVCVCVCVCGCGCVCEDIMSKSRIQILLCELGSWQRWHNQSVPRNAIRVQRALFAALASCTRSTDRFSQAFKAVPGLNLAGSIA
jgi:hypothetical protein